MIRPAADWCLNCNATSHVVLVFQITKTLASAALTAQTTCINSFKELSAKLPAMMGSPLMELLPVSTVLRRASPARCQTRTSASTATSLLPSLTTTLPTKHATKSAHQALTETAPCSNVQTALLLARLVQEGRPTSVAHACRVLRPSTCWGLNVQRLVLWTIRI